MLHSFFCQEALQLLSSALLPCRATGNPFSLDMSIFFPFLLLLFRFHVDDSEVTLNVCLGKQFSGGELFFRGIRCEKHVNTETQSEEIFDYSHVPGRAILHRGRHRHGARATTSGHRINLLLWCRSSVFRELRKYQKDFSGWCGECLREKKERQRQSVAATKMELLKREGEAPKEAAKEAAS
ncbi:2-oxoglutarate (2OG) and Fe(II)-dependent oxygenase superfamily protein [Actinidia rufa]|uniref:2-oxoglutarate (2OG) and Fe(II)-dependent oxygenase superfamily protein n=1 Tax=Actinidia rufa TaxID=165716 RepID=A0A7J0DD59_9ERIC|nr:2-oxoglutarate (2OG) and Fe(II)-dependent oxygenase superfamily protein [Actinidia rufa]